LSTKSTVEAVSDLKPLWTWVEESGRHGRPARIITPLALTPGTRLGVYEVTAQIGEGGMGQVFRATDTKLKRQVAIKILPPSLAGDHDRLARFQREAEVLASLNHPNIAAIYGLEETNGLTALVMELVEGDDLSQRIARGAIPTDEALPIARQIAEALEVAHEQGIIHRDLKPANIKVRSDGMVKVLDFGLAKAMEAPGGGMSPSMSQSPTITSPAMMTGVGVILGTAAYMSPEQARGKTVDRRADIWAFGAVLFEMLCGTPPFDGEDMAEVLGAVVRLEPRWEALPSDVPPPVRTLLQGCLVKDPRRRIANISTALFVLDRSESLALPAVGDAPARRSDPAAMQQQLRQQTDAAIALVRRTLRRRATVAAAAAQIVGAAVGIAIWSALRTALPLPETHVDIVTPSTDRPMDFVLSPDGRQIVFVASGDGVSRLWLRSLATTSALPLAGTDGATGPFWSPDGRSIGFFAGNALMRLDLGGGPPQTLARVEGPRSGAWNGDGVILFSPITTSPLFRVPASGGEAVPVTRLDRQTNHRFPFFLPDGRQFLFHAAGPPEAAGIYLGGLDSAETWRLTAADAAPGVYLSGWLVWLRSGALVAQRLDLERKALTGEPVTLADSAGGVSVSTTGLVAYRSGEGYRRQLVWFDRMGKALGLVGESGSLLSPELSPDGRRIAIDRVIQGNRDVWLMDLARGALTRLTFDAAADGFPVWAPDGSRIAFESLRTGSWDIWLKPSTGIGMEELVLGTPSNEWPLDWSKDGRFLLYYQDGGKTGADLWALPMTGDDRNGIAVANTPFEEVTGEFSPDGRWVAYETNESGRSEVVVQPFPTPTAKWQVSTSGGMRPQWRTDGRELYFVSLDGKLMSAAVAAEPSTFDAGTPATLTATPIRGLVGAVPKHQYAVSPDGRFLINTELDTADAPITLIQNWQPEAKK
jgi:Tol biopolymer transport system component